MSYFVYFGRSFMFLKVIWGDLGQLCRPQITLFLIISKLLRIVMIRFFFGADCAGTYMGVGVF